MIEGLMPSSNSFTQFLAKSLIIVFLAVSAESEALTIDVKLFSNASTQSCMVSPKGAAYFLVKLSSDGSYGETLFTYQPGYSKDVMNITVGERLIKVTVNGNSFGPFAGFALIQNSTDAHFIIKAKGPERIYSGDLRFRVHNNELQIVNRVDIEEYVAGVVESEGGHYAQYEYFKAQAVLARTWVMKNINKHRSEGYNVRDDESSQVYKSKAYLQYCSNIVSAVFDTRDTILCDDKGEPIFGAFHSNSGGQTMNSEDYWSETIPYLRSVKDTFSLAMDKAYWEKRIDKETFLRFVAEKMGLSASNADFRHAVLSFNQPERRAYMHAGSKKIKLRVIREHFKLRSTFFDVVEEDNTVLLRGRGFGHGVGLSQEGAMRMSELGYCYQDILDHYFQNARLSTISRITPGIQFAK